MPIILRDLTTAAQQAGVTAKGTQGTYGLSVQDLKDSGRSQIIWTVDQFAFSSASEAMLTTSQLVVSTNTVTTPTSYTITTGKYLWIQSLHLAYEASGTTIASLRPVYVAIRYNSAGAAVVGSSMAGRFAATYGGAAVTSAPTIVGSGEANDFTFADGLIFGPGNGSISFGFSAIAPGWVTGTTVPKLTMTCIAFEY